MPYCMHCGTESISGDKFCSGCGEPVVIPTENRPRNRRDPKQNENFVRLSEEKQAAEEYYRAVGSRHPHIWPVSGIGSAVFLLCIGAMMFFVYVVVGAEPELRYNPILRWAATIMSGLIILLNLNIVRYIFIPEVRPGSNPEMVGSKGSLLLALILIPFGILAILGWLGWLEPLFQWIQYLRYR